jgi:hypothetical protein
LDDQIHGWSCGNPQQHGGGSLRGPLLPSAVGQPKANLFVATLLLDEKSLLDSVKGVYSAICDWHQNGCNLPSDRFTGTRHAQRRAPRQTRSVQRIHTQSMAFSLHCMASSRPCRFACQAECCGWRPHVRIDGCAAMARRRSRGAHRLGVPNAKEGEGRAVAREASIAAARAEAARRSGAPPDPGNGRPPSRSSQRLPQLPHSEK